MRFRLSASRGAGSTSSMKLFGCLSAFCVGCPDWAGLSSLLFLRSAKSTRPLTPIVAKQLIKFNFYWLSPVNSFRLGLTSGFFTAASSNDSYTTWKKPPISS